MGLPPLLREPVFRRFYAAQTVSVFGDQVSLFAMPLVAVLVLDAGPVALGLLATLGLLPNLLFAFPAGAWVDRRGERRRVMIATDLVRAASLATVPAAYLLGVLTLVHLFIVAFVIGTFGVVFNVANSSLFVAVVSREQYIEGNSLVSGSRAASFVAGPSVAGVLVQTISAPVTLAVDAVSFLISALFLRSISPQEPATEAATRGHLAAGARFIARSPVVRVSLGATATINFFGFMYLALFPLYATQGLGVSAGLLGVVLGAGAIGGLVGSLVTAHLVRQIGVGPAFILGCIVMPLPLVLIPLAAGPQQIVLPMLFAAQFGSGLGVMILDISIGSIFAALVPDRLRSRFSGAYMVVNYGVRPLGALAAAGLGGLIGVHATLWIATLGALTGVLWFVRSPVPAMRSLPPSAEEEAAPLPVAA